MFLALDIAEVTGAAWGGERDGFPRNARWQLPAGASNFDRSLCALRQTILATIKAEAISAVCIEDVREKIDRSHGWDALIKLTSLNAVAREAAKASGCQILTVRAPTWRKHFLGTGSLDRNEAKLASMSVNRRLGWHFADDNVAEANGIWYWAMATNFPLWRPARAAA